MNKLSSAVVLAAASITMQAADADSGPFGPTDEPGFFNAAQEHQRVPKDPAPSASDAQPIAHTATAPVCAMESSTGLVFPQCRPFTVNPGGHFGSTAATGYVASKVHKGCDLRSTFGEPVFSAVRGKVVHVSTSSDWGLDRAGRKLAAIVIEADELQVNGVKYFVYGHIDPSVAKGDAVRQGEVIGVATLAEHHHIHIGTAVGGMVPTSALGRQADSNTNLAPFVDCEEAFGLKQPTRSTGRDGSSTTGSGAGNNTASWKSVARQALDRAEKMQKSPKHSDEDTCRKSLAGGSKKCMERTYKPKRETWYVLIADVEKRRTRKCEKAALSRCDTIDRW